MDSFETLLKRLGDTIGCVFTPDERGLYEISVKGQTLLLCCQEAEGLVLSFGVVKTFEEPLQVATLRHALSLSLFGYGTHGFSLGLFRNTLLLSGVFALETLSVERLVEQLYLLALQIETVRQTLQQPFGQMEVKQEMFENNMPSLAQRLRI